MNTKMLVTRVWATTGLSFKVKKLIDEKTRKVLEETNPEVNQIGMLEDISKLLSLDWKVSRQLWRMREELKAVKEGAQE
ncbi:MAG: hypothetical protein PHN56_01475 [Candidatus Nanoarchaeia archaeon]|nr:hypothetical protein [Candidatus Nanoarchaeia archaeon]